MRTTIRITGIAIVCAAMVAAAAEAQTARASRPYRGLFGTAGASRSSNQALDVLLFAGGAEDRDAAVAVPTPEGENVRRGDRYSDATLSLRYQRGTPASPWLLINARGAGRYQPAVAHVVPVNFEMSARMSFQPWRNGRIVLEPTVGHSPYFQFVPLPDFPIPEDERLQMPEPALTDFMLVKHPASVVRGGVQFAQALGRRMSLQANYDRGMVRTRDRAYDLRTESGAAQLRLRLTRHTAFRGGYTVSEGEYRGQLGDTSAFFGPPAADGSAFSANLQQNRAFDLGIDFARPLLARRRVTVGFVSGATQATSGGKTYSMMTGEASLRKEFGRTWAAAVAYRRALQYLALLPGPFFGDGLVISASGQLARRVSMGFTAGRSSGAIGFGPEANGARTDTGGADLTIGVTRHMAVSAQYAYYGNEFDRVSGDLPYPRRLARHTGRVGLKLWLPILN